MIFITVFKTRRSVLLTFNNVVYLVNSFFIAYILERKRYLIGNNFSLVKKLKKNFNSLVKYFIKY